MPQGRPQDYVLPERDPQTRIQEILAGISQPEPEQGFWMRLLQAVPQALAVGASQDPGSALQNVINTKFQQVQIEKQRKQRLKELGATLEIEDLLERTREGRREAAETRRFERETAQREKEFKTASKEQRTQLMLQNRFQKSRDQFQANETRLRDMRQNQASKDLTQLQANATRENQFFAEVAKNSMEAIMSGEMDAGTAVDLYSRLANKELPNKQDITKMNKAIKSQQEKIQRMALERIGAEARTRVSGKSYEESRIDFASAYAKQNPMIWITDVDGQQKLVKRDVDALTQQPALISGQKFIREATLEEVHQYALQSLPPIQGAGGMNIPHSSNKLAHAEGLIREAAKTRPFEQVKTDFLKPETYQNLLKLTKGEADAIIQKVQSEMKVEPSAMPEEELRTKLSEIDEELKFAGSKRRPELQKQKEEIKKQLEPFSAEEKKREDVRKLEKIVLDLRNKISRILSETLPPGGGQRVKAFQDKLDDAIERLEYAKTQLKK